MIPRPGEIYLVYESGRPAIIVSREKLNRGDYVIVVLVTTRRLEERWNLPNCLPFHKGQFGLDKDCVAQAESITFLEKSDLNIEYGILGRLNNEAIRDLVRAIGHVISAECEPV